MLIGKRWRAATGDLEQSFCFCAHDPYNFCSISSGDPNPDQAAAIQLRLSAIMGRNLVAAPATRAEAAKVIETSLVFMASLSPEQVTRLQWEIGQVHLAACVCGYYTGKYAEAKAHAQTANQIYEQLDVMRQLLKAKSNLATVLASIGDVVPVRRISEEILEQYRQQANRADHSLADLYVSEQANLADSLLRLGRFETARKVIADGLTYCTNNYFVRSQLSLSINAFILAVETRQDEEAQKRGQESLDLSRNLGDENYLAQIYSYWAELHCRQGGFAQAGVLLAAEQEMSLSNN